MTTLGVTGGSLSKPVLSPVRPKTRVAPEGAASTARVAAPESGLRTFSPPPARPQLATLTEEDFFSQCERVTVPPPMPMEEYVRTMMAAVPEDGPPASAGTGEDAVAVELASMAVMERVDLVHEVVESYLERLGSRADIPHLVVARERLAGLELEPAARFLLALVDGETPIEDLVEFSAMPEHEALGVLDQLREGSIIEIRPRRVRTTMRSSPG